MICEQGKVVAIDGDVASVEVIQQSSCQACSANKACGTKVLKGLFQTKRHYLKMSFSHIEQTLRVGDNVEIDIEESALLRSSLLVYVLPLFSLVGMALAFNIWFQSEWLSMLGAVIGFTVALFFARAYSMQQSHSELFQPRLSRVLVPVSSHRAEEIIVKDSLKA